MIIYGYSFLQQDDAYIFYTYAKNIAEGNGYVFSFGERVNATTSPLYTLLLALVFYIVKSLFPNSLPIIGLIIGYFSLLTISLFMVKIFKKQNDSTLPVFVILIFLANPLLKYGTGMETFLNLSLIVTSIYYYAAKKYPLAFFLAGLSILARMDSALFALILFAFYIYDERRLPRLIVVSSFLAVILPWFIFNKIYFNSFMPTTVGVKLNQYEWGMFGKGLIFLKGILNKVPGTFLTTTILAIVILLCTVALFLKQKEDKLDKFSVIVFVWGALLFFIYAFVLNAPPSPWYYTPFALPITVLISKAFLLYAEKINKKIKNATIVFLFIAAAVLPLKTMIDGYNPRYIYYREAAAFLNTEAKQGTLISVDEIGILGYYYRQGKIIDCLGLITPEAEEHLLKKDFGWYITKYKPEFIVNDYPEVQEHAGGKVKIFIDNYKPLKIFESKGEQIAIYNRKKCI